MSADVLVIEDNEQNLYLITFLLERAGYRVTQARDGPEGIVKATVSVPGVILLDIQLPGMDGFAVLEALRRIESLARVPIIAVTSHAMAGDRERILAAGCDGYMEKPIDAETFIADMERHRNRAGGG